MANGRTLVIVQAATDKISELAPEGIDVLVNNSGVGTPQTEPLTM